MHIVYMKNEHNITQDSFQVGSRLKIIRKIFKLTQETMAQEINVERATLAQWERGANMARVSAMVRLTDCFPITLDFIYKNDLSNLNYRIRQKVKTDDVRQVDLLPEEFSEQDKAWVGMIRSMTPEKQKEARKRVDEIAQRNLVSSVGDSTKKISAA